MAYLEVNAACKSFGQSAGRLQVLHNINLSIERGQFVAIVGYSGSGKTTLISLLAGLIQPDTGSIELEGRPIAGPGPDRGVMFQNYSLLPWLTVAGNIKLAVDQAFPAWSAERKLAHIDKFIAMVNLLPARHKRPSELSGGMRQRVAFARALATEPRVLLLDEPFGALDALTRSTLQDEIVSIWERDRKTVVMITNDVDEALLLADRIIPLTPGPGATLGPCFNVDLPRPRKRTEMNFDPRFKKIRNEVTEYLVSVGQESRKSSVRQGLTLPAIQPRYITAA